MPQNFIGCDRDQELLLPASLKEWLPESHLAWFVLEAVGELDLDAFYVAYRQDGWGRAAHDPAMMVALFVYAYATGVRTSRGIERHCFDDVALAAGHQDTVVRGSAPCTPRLLRRVRPGPRRAQCRSRQPQPLTRLPPPRGPAGFRTPGGR